MSNSGIYSFVPYLHVADVQASIDFYSVFGMALDSRFGPEGAPIWARMKGDNTDLMLARASGPIDPGVQAALFYLHTPDVVGMRAHLLASGLVDGGVFTGAESQGSEERKGTVFAVTHPHYMPSGEIRVHDPDGYVLLVGQIG